MTPITWLNQALPISSRIQAPIGTPHRPPAAKRRTGRHAMSFRTAHTMAV